MLVYCGLPILNMKWIEQDSGLWSVWDKDGNEAGWIFDRGSKVAGEKCDGYDALDGWAPGWKATPGNLIGKYKTFMGAVAGIKRWLEAGRPELDKLPDYHPDEERKRFMRPPKERKPCPLCGR